MSINDKKVLSREKRLTTISHYDGNLNALQEELSGQEVRQRVRTFTQDSYSELLYALQVLSSIEDIAVIIHGAVGCAFSGIYYYEKYRNLGWYTTNLDERDTILGGDDKLRETVLRACEEKSPRAIFIVGTPVVAINNDDVSSIILELEEEVSAKLIWIDTDGFKTKAAINGYDIVAHALLKYIVKPADKEKGSFVNLISFSEKDKDLIRITDLLAALNLEWNLIPQYASYDNIADAAGAGGSIVLNEDEGGYFADILEKEYGVPHVKAELPVGSAPTRRFIRTITSYFQLPDAGQYEKEGQELAKPYIGKKILRGKTVFLNLGIDKIKVYAALVRELGGEVAGVAIPFVDPENKKKLIEADFERKGIPVLVLNGQPYELANVVRKSGAQYYLSEEGDLQFLNNLDCIPLSIHSVSSIGYEGIRDFTNLVEKVTFWAQQKERVGRYFTSVYQDGWLKRSSNWYVKQEVR